MPASRLRLYPTAEGKSPASSQDLDVNRRIIANALIEAYYYPKVG
jgi:hypothetical protein